MIFLQKELGFLETYGTAFIKINYISDEPLFTDQGKQQTFLNNFSTAEQTIALDDMLESDTDTWWEALVDKLQCHMARTTATSAQQASHYAGLASLQSNYFLQSHMINNVQLTEYNMGPSLWKSLTQEQCVTLLEWRSKAINNSKNLPTSDNSRKLLMSDAIVKAPPPNYNSLPHSANKPPAVTTPSIEQPAAVPHTQSKPLAKPLEAKSVLSTKPTLPMQYSKNTVVSNQDYNQDEDSDDEVMTCEQYMLSLLTHGLDKNAQYKMNLLSDAYDNSNNMESIYSFFGYPNNGW